MPRTTTIDLTYRSASLTLAIWDDKNASFIDVYTAEKGKGHATGLLNELIRFADRSNLSLLTQAEPYGDEPRLSDKKLVEFYEKFGFVRMDDTVHPYMERKPK